jgi:hypothetical protein
MMISFLTLFFGLISGPYPVELAVRGPVAAVELSVDDRASARLPGPPWKATINFGSSLAPHRIVARALDAEGKELSRAEEWANLPHPRAKVEILLEGKPSSPPQAAKLAWTNLLGERLASSSLTFDGVPVSLDSAGRATLPPHDLGTLHVLTAEVKFTPPRTVRADVVYGGEYGSEVSTELTAVPLRVRSGALPPPEKLAGWLTAGGQPLPAVAVEEGPAQLFVVRSPEPEETRNKLASRGRLTPQDIRFEMRLDKDDRLRLIRPYTSRVAGSGQVSDLFDISADYTARDGGIPWLLRSWPSATLGAEKELRRRIADAVAVAGLEAMTENRRRAVLLLLAGDEKGDQSRYDAATVRRFLAAIRVPLFVWTLGKPVPGSFAESWGPSQDVTQVKNLYKAVGDLQDDLRSQRIVLVDGRLLPQSIALGPAARGVELVESADPR